MWQILAALAALRAYEERERTVDSTPQEPTVLSLPLYDRPILDSASVNVQLDGVEAGLVQFDDRAPIRADLAQTACLAYLNTLRKLCDRAGVAQYSAVQKQLKTTVTLEDAIESTSVGLSAAKFAAPLGAIAAPIVGVSAGFLDWIAKGITAAANYEDVKSQNRQLQVFWAVVHQQVKSPPVALFHLLSGLQLQSKLVVRNSFSDPFDAVQWTAVVLSAIDACTRAGVKWERVPVWDARRVPPAAVPRMDLNGSERAFEYKPTFRGGYKLKNGKTVPGYFWNFACLFDSLFLDCSVTNDVDGKTVRKGSEDVRRAYIQTYTRRPRRFLEQCNWTPQDNAHFVAQLVEDGSRYKDPSIICKIGRSLPDNIAGPPIWTSRVILKNTTFAKSFPSLVSVTT